MRGLQLEAPRRDKTDVTVQRLRKLIDDTGLARQDIADEIGCDVSTITKHYNGTRNITTDFIVMYAKYFKVSTDYLLGMTDAKTTDKDRRYITDVTGLSEGAVAELEFMKNYVYTFIDTENSDSLQSVMNRFIDSGSFQNLVVAMTEYQKEVSEQHDYLTDYYKRNQGDLGYSDEAGKRDKRMKLALFDVQESAKDHIKKELREKLDTIEDMTRKIGDAEVARMAGEQ